MPGSDALGMNGTRAADAPSMHLPLRGALVTALLLASAPAFAQQPPAYEPPPPPAPIEDPTAPPPSPAPQPERFEHAFSASLTGEIGATYGGSARIAYLPSPKVALGASFAYAHPFTTDTAGDGIPSNCAVDATGHDLRFGADVRPRLARFPGSGGYLLDLWMPLEFGALFRHTSAHVNCGTGADASGDHSGPYGGLGLALSVHLAHTLSLDLEGRVRVVSLGGSIGIEGIHTAGIGITGYLPL